VRRVLILPMLAVLLHLPPAAAQSAPPPAQAVYTYDQLGRLIRAEYPSGRRIDYSYDAAGNRRQVTVAG